MHKVNEKYLAILRVELEDLQEDIEELITQITQEREEGNLTNYVFMENLALFRNELLGVDAFGRILDQVDPGAFATIDELVEHLKNRFKVKVKEAGLAEVIEVYVDRKLEKVQRYVSQV